MYNIKFTIPPLTVWEIHEWRTMVEKLHHLAAYAFRVVNVHITDETDDSLRVDIGSQHMTLRRVNCQPETAVAVTVAVTAAVEAEVWLALVHVIHQFCASPLVAQLRPMDMALFDRGLIRGQQAHDCSQDVPFCPYLQQPSPACSKGQKRPQRRAAPRV